MLDPNRYSLDAATVGFRKRMGLSVNWGNFNEAMQVQTEAIKVRRELEETPISEIHVMGGQGIGIAGNGKTNELARQSRQMNGYPLRSFYATGGAVVVPQKHGEGLMAIPMNLGLTQYAQYNGVVGNYVSSFTEPLNAPMDSNLMLLARTGAQLRNESISNPFKVLQFNLNMNSTLEQIQGIEKKHQELRGYNKEMLAKDLTALNNSAYSVGESVDTLRRKRSGAAAQIGDSATTQPGSGTGILAGTQAPGVMTRSKRPKNKLSPADEESVLEYLSVIMPEEQAVQEASVGQAQAAQDFQNAIYSSASEADLYDSTQSFLDFMNSPTPRFEPKPFDPVADLEAETKEDGYVDEGESKTDRYYRPRTPWREEERPKSSKGLTFQPQEDSDEDRRSQARQLSSRFFTASEEEIYKMITDMGYNETLQKLKRDKKMGADDNNTLLSREYRVNEALLGNTLANQLVDQALSQGLAVPIKKADDLAFGPTGTFKNAVEEASVKTNQLFSAAAITRNNLDIASGAPNSFPNSGTLKSTAVKSSDRSPLIVEELLPTGNELTIRQQQQASMNEFANMKTPIKSNRKGKASPASGMTTGEPTSPSPFSHVVQSGNNATPRNLGTELLTSPKGNKVKVSRI